MRKFGFLLGLIITFCFLPGCGTVLTGAALFLLMGDEDDPAPPTPGAPSDTTAPAAITDLFATPGVSSGSVAISWTATGDDGTSGGPASAYVVKYSTSTITAANFASATTYNQGWAPVAPGNTENHTLFGLTPGQTCYFAIVVSDEVPNASGISNVPSAQAFSGADTVAPAAIQDLSAFTGGSLGEIGLTWTASGDDGNVGTASAYVVKYSTASINPGNFASATTYVQSWNPVSGGNTEIRTLTGLTPGQLYFVAIKVEDEIPNTSPISNVPSATAASDIIAPSLITDLAASGGTNPGEIDLTWTASGDDGTTGTATAYVVKYSTALIDGANFNSATTYAQAWTPLASGNTENYTLTGLTPGQLYYVAIKVEDEIPNTSGISNVPAATATATPDTTAPAAITDLSAGTGANGCEIDISWTATGDDGSTGTATSYEVKYSTSTINAGNYASATTYAQSWMPLASGNVENYTLTGLTQGQLYYVAIKVLDEVPNTSAISNVPSATAASGPDTTAPAAITDLGAATGTTNGAIDLTWTATGDDGNTGTATSFVVKYALGPINAGNFDLATTYTQSWTPLAAGQTENRTMFGLTPGWTYNVAIKVLDEVPNTSGISNVPGATVSSASDTVAPAPISDLAATGSLARGSVDLTWTAVGDDGNVGTATSYEIRYSTSSINAGNWTSATVFPCLLAPQTAGQSENHTVTGLAPSTTYYFAIKARDEVPNGGPISNSPSTSTVKAWSWQHPLPTIHSPYELWGTSASNIYGVGSMGTISHYNGSTWTVMSSGSLDSLADIWGANASDIFIVGSNGTILHYDGSTWSRMTSGTTVYLKGVWGTGSTNVYASGANGTLLNYNGSSWSPVNTGTATNLDKLWGSSSSDIRVVAWTDTLYYDGNSWSLQSNGFGASGPIWGAAPNDYHAGCASRIYHYDGTSWTQVLSHGGSGRDIRTIWGRSANEVYAVANQGIISQYNGTSWSNMTSGTTRSLSGIWGSSSSDIWTGGGYGTMLHYDGSSWSSLGTNLFPQGASIWLNAVWGAGANDVFAVGQETGPLQVILHYDGSSWSKTNVGSVTQRLSDLWGSSGSDVFGVGDSGYIRHYNGTAWSQQTSGTTNSLYCVWGTSASDVYAVGSGGTILKYDGSSWSSMSSPTTNGLLAVWGLSSNYIIAVGNNGTIVRYNGTSWSTMTSGTSNSLRSVWGTSMTNVYAVGDSGLILNYNGTSWNPISLGLSEHLRSVFGNSASDIYVVGQNGIGLHYDGTNWNRMSKEIWSGAYLNGIWSSSTNDVFAVGDSGMILHWP